MHLFAEYYQKRTKLIQNNKEIDDKNVEDDRDHCTTMQRVLWKNICRFDKEVEKLNIFPRLRRTSASWYTKDRICHQKLTMTKKILMNKPCF